MDAFIEIDGQQQVATAFPNLSIHVQGCDEEVEKKKEDCSGGDSQKQKSLLVDENHHGVCAICLNKIALQETALVKGCEHAYCVICILRWASYKKEPTCPQCKHPFEFLNIHRSLDGSIHDYMFEESVCLLLRAAWFTPLHFESHEHQDDHEPEDSYPYYYEDDEEEDLDEVYLGRSSNINIRIGNRRWGHNGFVRAGKQEARPLASGAGSSSRGPKKTATTTAAGGAAMDSGGAAMESGGAATDSGGAATGSGAVGRRAKRTMKREAADKAAAAKHQQHLVRLGRK